MKNKKIKNLLKLIPALILVIAIIIVSQPKTDKIDIGIKASSNNKGIITQAYDLNIDFSNEYPPITAKKSKTILMYIVGSDLESSNNNASRDLREILDADVDIDNCNVVAFTGGSYGWEMNIPSDKDCALYLARKNGIKDFYLVNTFNDNDMADPTTLEFFLNYAYYSFPADEYDLILWDHGGAVSGFGADEKTGNLMGLNGIGDALKKSPFNGSNKMKWIAFDACLMAGMETALLLADYADYLIASEEVMKGCGFDYSFLNTVSKANINGDEAGRDISDMTFDFIVKYISDFEQDFTMSCIDLNSIGNVAKALDELSLKTTDALKSYFNDYSSFRRKAFEFGSGYDYDTIDLNSFAEFWSKYFPTEAENLTDAISNAVTYNIAKRETSKGISIFNAYSTLDTNLYDVADFVYKSAEICPNYLDFMKEFKDIYENGNDVDWNSQNNTESTTRITTEASTETTTETTTQSNTEASTKISTERTTETTTSSFDEGITRITRSTAESQQTTRNTTNATSAPTTMSTTTQNITENNPTDNTPSTNHDIEYYLSNEQDDSVAIVYKMILTELGGYGGYTCSYQSTEVNIEDNRITADFDDTLYVLESDGETMALNLYEIQKVGNERIFEAQVLACRTERFDRTYAAPFCMRIIFSDENPNGRVIGLRPLNIERGYAPVEIKDGYSFMSLDTGFKGITRDKNGHIKPLGEWEEAYPAMSNNTLTVKNGLSLSKKDINNKSNSFMCLYIEDTHGYAFMTELVDLKKK